MRVRERARVRALFFREQKIINKRANDVTNCLLDPIVAIKVRFFNSYFCLILNECLFV